ncbi:Rid family detoxifying hydrolase [bacterium]|nr:Rid family detoxifying hydrolase [bacterium]
MKEVFKSVEGAPGAVGPYSVAVSTGDILYTSGQLPMDANTGEIIGDNSATQAKFALENLKTIIEKLGSDMKSVLKVTIFLTDMKSFAEVNEVYSTYFKENCPARSCVEVSNLPKGALIEIEAIALINK